MSRPKKGETWNTEKHYGCRVLKYPVGERLSEISAKQGKKFGNLCNAVIKKYLVETENEFEFSPETASIMLDKATEDNPKINFTLYLTDEEHAKLKTISSNMGISMNRLAVCFLREYVKA